MKAVDTLRGSIVSQYRNVLNEVEKAKLKGHKNTVVAVGSILDPEVVNQLAKDGYDLECVKGFLLVVSHTKVSWENAVENVAGKVKHIDVKDLIRTKGTSMLGELKEQSSSIIGELKEQGNSILDDLKERMAEIVDRDEEECDCEECDCKEECEAEESTPAEDDAEKPIPEDEE